MKENSEQHGDGGHDGPEETPRDAPVVSYTPEQRRLIRKGLRIWARVAIRSYMRKKEAGSLSEAVEDGGGETAQ